MDQVMSERFRRADRACYRIERLCEEAHHIMDLDQPAMLQDRPPAWSREVFRIVEDLITKVISERSTVGSVYGQFSGPFRQAEAQLADVVDRMYY